MTLPLARTTDPETSHQAAAGQGGNTVVKGRIAGLLAHRPMTDPELLAAYTRVFGHISPSGCRSRRHELTVEGMVEDTGRRVAGPNGRQQIVWHAPGAEPIEVPPTEFTAPRNPLTMRLRDDARAAAERRAGDEPLRDVIERMVTAYARGESLDQAALPQQPQRRLRARRDPTFHRGE